MTPEETAAKDRSEWLPLAVLALVTVTALAISIFALAAGMTTIFQNLFYLPIILACAFYLKRGFAFSLFLAAAYFTLVAVFSQDPAVLSGALIRVLFFILIASVITWLSIMRVQAEGALKRSEEFNRGLAENMPDLVMVYDRDRKVRYVNPRAAAALGYPAAGMEGTDILSYVAPGQQAMVAAAIRERFATGKGRSMEIDLVTARGDRLTVISKGALLNFRNEPAVLILLADITDRKRAEEELKESEKRYRDMFELNHAIMLIVNPETAAIEDANSAAGEYYGYSRDEMRRLLITDINIAEPDVTRQNMSQAAGGRGALFNFRHRKKSGEIRDVVVFSAPVSYKGRRLLHSIIEDVTDRKRAEDALQIAIKKLNMLSSITRHDILNQVTGLRTFLELSREDLKGTKFADFVEKEDQAAAAIQRQIEFTKYYQDIGVNAPRWQDVAEVIDAARIQLNPQGVDVDVSVGNAEVYADSLLEKVFYNLMENSLRHGEHVTRMAFSLEKTGAGLTIVYTDNGAGISAEDKHKLFQRGFGKHTGLGLFLSREILAITGLTIAETGEPGRGVRFEMAVPDGMYRLSGGQDGDRGATAQGSGRDE